MPVEVAEGSTILEAARKVNIDIPTLCYHKDLSIAGNCRLCVVEQVGAHNLLAACAVPVRDNMQILTNSQKVYKSRKHIIELLLSEHNCDCLKCVRSGNCQLQDYAHEYRTDYEMFLDLVAEKNYSINMFASSIIKDDSKCIRCQRCVRTCAELQSVNALCTSHKGYEMKISTFMDKPIDDVVCSNCGQCINRCPTGALSERNYISQVMDAIYDPTKHVVVQTAPAVRIGLGELFEMEPGHRVTGQMVTALKMLGFDSVLDTDFTADLTIMEEGTELLTRLKKALVDGDKDVVLPMTTSCSPGWIKFIEHTYPHMLDNLSTCKSPQQMFGALAKTYYAEKRELNPKDIVSVSIMPCTAKKFESNRPEMADSGYQDVDFVLTTRELGDMIKTAGINFTSLPKQECDSILGESTGAGVIFGATGGVMEAALRTAYEIVTGREIPFENLDVLPVRGMEGVRDAAIKIEGCVPAWSFLEGAVLKVAIAHGLANARALMNAVKEGTADYHFIEIMACPGGCLGGGGQPIPTDMDVRIERAKAIYAEDANKKLRKSHENPEVIQIYEEFLKEPLGHKSHELLHTHYTKRKEY